MEVLNPGQIFATRYRILRRLAEGGMGAVYVALQEATELEVALKVLWPHILQHSQAVERFGLEAKISARIKSDHIVQVFDAGFDPETKMPFLVMELLEGATLQDLIEKQGPRRPAEAIELLTQAARGLDRAHAYKDPNGQFAPVIHRDLKPDNLFVTWRDNGEPLVKILDFGIAKILSQSTSLSREIKGTPLYMAYEQATGQPVSPQTDIWALGLIAYFVLTGNNYWRSASSEHADLNSLLTEIVTLPIARPSDRIEEFPAKAMLPAAFDVWFQRCVNRDPSARFASAGVAVNELRTVLSVGSPVANVSSSIAFDSTVAPSNRATPSAGVSSATMSPAAVTQVSPLPAKRFGSLWLAGLLGIGALGGAVVFLRGAFEAPASDFSQLPSSPPLPSPPTLELLSNEPVVAPRVVAGSLRITPANATVKVNGEPRSLKDGKLELSGAQDARFELEVTLGAHRKTESVKLLADGSIEPALIELTVPLASKVVAQKPQQSGLISARPEPPSVVAAPEASQLPAASSPPAKLDPLAGPRSH